MASNGLRTQYPYAAGDGLSPRPLYDYPSPTSNYSGVGGAVSPSFYPMAYQISPRFGGSAFIPPPDVFVDGRKEFDDDGGYTPTPREFKRRMSEVNRDPVAMHLLVETAIIDSQKFDILTVEEVEVMKQEQKGLDTRLNTTRRKLASETKIRDATRSLSRLVSKDNGHQRGSGSRGSNAVQDPIPESEELTMSSRKVDELTRDLLEIESRMRLIDMQLLMHTAAVLQMTHNGPRKRKQNGQTINGEDRRPDSPASIYTYENDPNDRDGEDGFDERSFYRSPENLDGLMDALQNGTHHRTTSIDRHASIEQHAPIDHQNDALVSMSKRLEDLNERTRDLIVQANPERGEEYSLPPLVPMDSIDASSVERQLDFLDQGLQTIGTDQSQREAAGAAMAAVEERLEGINNQLYAMLSKADDNVQPPPTGNSGKTEDQLNYMEDTSSSLGQLQYQLNAQIDDLRSTSMGSEDVEKYETALKGIWQTMLAGEEEARERKRERRRLLAEDPDNSEELSPDEDYIADEQYSLIAFESKVKYLFRRASSLKDKQTILIRQIKQQRELNSKSDAQREDQVNRLNDQVLSARSDKKTMEGELERAMSQLRVFDNQKGEEENLALHNVESRNTGLEQEAREAKDRAEALESQLTQSRSEAEERVTTLESQLTNAQNEARAEAAAIQAQLSESSVKIEETTAALASATAAKEEAETTSAEANKALAAKEEELRSLEGEVVRLTTELTFAKAELDGAYGTRAQRVAESGTSRRDFDELLAKNATYAAEVTALQKISEVASQSEQEARDSERNLKAELAGMATDYEALTRDAIQNEKDRDTLEAAIDKLRSDKEALEMELTDERVKWLGIRSPSVAPGGAGSVGLMGGDGGTTSIRMLREDFRKMMRERTAEGLRALRVSHFFDYMPPYFTMLVLTKS
ncbi:hypothetical protein P280DRAFT_448048 [Massarina eburnea CBS 473.64]|uniref:Uncharacterized protein n=1 Tax=Massarina eburnea CBS 473.64 TaxID=1395130 RepID=A0A6A6S8N5_9PLEO|nr:hypothetical protein P280DRAFT_448048 [Massarina eburnea CBS 473.64]